MENRVGKRILDVQRRAMEDPRYAALAREYQALDRRFVEMIKTLTVQQRDTVLDLVGVANEMNLRLLEIGFAIE